MCRSLYDCPSVLSYFQGTITPDITNYLRALQCRNGNGRFPFVCCGINTGFYGPQQSYYQNWLQNQSPARTENVDNSQPTRNYNAAFGQCGLPSLAQRIFGGDDAQLDDYPWIVLLEYRNRTYTQLLSFLCVIYIATELKSFNYSNVSFCVSIATTMKLKDVSAP